MMIRAVRIVVFVVVGIIYVVGIGIEAWTLTGFNVMGTIVALCALPIMFAPVVWFARKTRSG
jgi:hypothetical protein